MAKSIITLSIIRIHSQKATPIVKIRKREFSSKSLTSCLLESSADKSEKIKYSEDKNHSFLDSSAEKSAQINKLKRELDDKVNECNGYYETLGRRNKKIRNLETESNDLKSENKRLRKERDRERRKRRETDRSKSSTHCSIM